MAGDWIKMRATILQNPRVIRMARELAADRAFIDWWLTGTRRDVSATVVEVASFQAVVRVVAMSCLQLWAAANEMTSDGLLKNATPFELDEMAGVPSFGNAMVSVGWAIEEEEGILLPNFTEHNTPVARRPKTGAERVREHRERKRQLVTNCNETALQSNDQEKKREEKKEDPPTPQRGEGAILFSEPQQPSDAAAQRPACRRDDGFEVFWQAYPRKTDKAKAAKSWRRLSPDPQLQSLILAAVERQKAWAQWLRGVIPHPTTWLNNERWLDEEPCARGGPQQPRESANDVIRRTIEARQRQEQEDAHRTARLKPKGGDI